MGKHIVLDFRSESTCFHAKLSLGVGLASPQDRVDPFQEGTHSVIALRPRGLEPGDITIWSRDIAVRAYCNVHDDLSGVLHVSSPPRTLEIIPRRETGSHMSRSQPWPRRSASGREALQRIAMVHRTDNETQELAR